MEAADTVYTAESRIRHPVRLVRETAVNLVAARELAWRLMLRDLNAQYRQSLLGYVWAFLPSVVMAAGFTLARASNVIVVGDTGLPYPAYVLLGTVLWQTFTEALFGPVQALVGARTMMAKVQLRHEALILAKIGESILNLAVKLVLVVVVFAWYAVPVTAAAAVAPVALVQIVILGTFLGVLVAPVGALYGDVPRALPILTGVWLFLTPVVYPMPQTGLFATLVTLNPVTPLILTARELMTTGQVSHPIEFVVVSVMATVGLFVAMVGYRLAMPFVVERMSV